MKDRAGVLAIIAALVGVSLLLTGLLLRPPPPPAPAAEPTATGDADAGGMDEPAPTLDERLYQVGRLPAVDCPPPVLTETSVPALESFADQAVERCLMPAWGPALDRVEVRLDPPKVRAVADSAVDSACGRLSTDNQATAFYCPSDTTIYLFADRLSRYSERANWLPMSVLSHEFGHHVQNATNSWPIDYSDEKGALRRTELQAECLSGVWFTNGQRSVPGFSVSMIRSRYISNETHGSIESREYWFRAGFRSGDPVSCQTYTASAKKVA